jgi:glycerol-3-phosphate dehydrogenase
MAPTLDQQGLKAAYCTTMDSLMIRLAISIAQTVETQNFASGVLNYFPVTGFLKMQKKICGVWVKDALTGKDFEVKSKVVINATGVFTDSVMKMDDAKHKNIMSPSQGIHLVVDKEFLPGDTAIMIPRTDDGRVLFAVPWYDKVVLGTTDTPVETISAEPVPIPEEIEFILKHIGRYLSKDPQLHDVRSMFAGLRPLVKGKTRKTAALSRDHLIAISDSGMITITGGKWTTYRKMAEDVMDIAIKHFNLPGKPCITKELRLYGHDKQVAPAEIKSLNNDELKAAIKRSVQEEMCMTVEDFLTRRTRQLLLDARIAKEKAPEVAIMMAKELNKDETWIKEQINNFNSVAKNYLPIINPPAGRAGS